MTTKNYGIPQSGTSTRIRYVAIDTDFKTLWTDDESYGDDPMNEFADVLKFANSFLEFRKTQSRSMPHLLDSHFEDSYAFEIHRRVDYAFGCPRMNLYSSVEDILQSTDTSLEKFQHAKNLKDRENQVREKDAIVRQVLSTRSEDV